MKRSVRGFTLIEIIMVLALMGIATSMGVTVFYKAIDAWSKVETRAELNAKASNIFESIRKDLTEAASAKVSGVAVKSAKGVALAAKDAAAAESDILTIPVSTDKGLVSVTYRLAPTEGGGSALARVVGDEKRLPAPNDYVQNSVAALKIEFLAQEANSNWQPAWDKPVMPAAIRVSMLISDPDRPYLKISRKAVFPVKVD